MATDSLGMVKELRERTGAGILDCKAALEASGGDLEKAVDHLRKKGAASALKRAGREAKEGIVVVRIEGKTAVLAEVNCETDFVARTEDFKALAALAAEETFHHGDQTVSSSKKLADRVAELSGKIGEKIVARRTKLVKAGDGYFFSYVHANQKIGVVIELSASKTGPALDELGKNLAMQVAAQSPIALEREAVPAAVVERERAIFKEEIKGKPENIAEKILQGKLDKFYQAVCLLEQPFIKDDKQSVRALVAAVEKNAGGQIRVKQFVRFQLGETIPS